MGGRKSADPPSFYDIADIALEPALLDVAASLHDHNVQKYLHALNFYSKRILERIAHSSLAEHLLLCIRRDKVTNDPVQVSISLIDHRSAQMYGLVQGIHRALVSPGYNLYIADTYELLLHAERHGLRQVNLGRGAHIEKRRLGAMIFLAQHVGS